MKCPECDAENPDDAEFCSLCYARFQANLRARDIDEAASRLREKDEEARLRCPSCGSLSPLETQFCLDCGFVFEDLEALMVNAEDIERLHREAEEIKKKDEEVLLAEAIEVTAESNGADIMRNLSDHLSHGIHPRIHARGRNAVTYAMKIVALLGEDMRDKGMDLRLRVNLITETAITHLEDVELELVLESV
ncbi:MAG: zinc ribbon domain-containing protein [Actinobacteria bacterium]|jgi:DNA-directed RNA polymerase subunit RPC12/RpoP/stage V sporulation protein SpoVS|nr:MAG: zinc ribbon domain-containing protein [Actinomycetota bacterium]